MFKDFKEMPPVAWILDDKRKAQLLKDALEEWHPRLSFIVTSSITESAKHHWYKVMISNDDIQFDDYAQASRDSDRFLSGYNARVQQEIEEKYEN